MKTLLFGLLCVTVLLGGCSSYTKYNNYSNIQKLQQDLILTNERINVLSAENRELKYQNTLRDEDIIELKEKVYGYKQAYIE